MYMRVATRLLGGNTSSAATARRVATISAPGSYRAVRCAASKIRPYYATHAGGVIDDDDDDDLPPAPSSHLQARPPAPDAYAPSPSTEPASSPVHASSGPPPTYSSYTSPPAPAAPHHTGDTADPYPGYPQPPPTADIYPSITLPDPAYTPLASLTPHALPTTTFDPALANIASITGVVQAVTQELSVSSSTLTVHMGVPAYGSRIPQQLQVLLKGQTAVQLAPHVRPGMVLHAVGTLTTASRAPVRLVASSLTEVAWDSISEEIQQFFSLAAQEKPDKPQRARSTEKSTSAPKKEPYENQRMQYNEVLQHGSFEAAAEATGRITKTVSNNVMAYVEATAPEYINWAGLLQVTGIALSDPDPLLPTVRELVEAVDSFLPLVKANPRDYVTKAGLMKLRPLLDHIRSRQAASPLWHKLEPHTLSSNQLDRVYRILQLGRFIANTHLDADWMANHVPQEPPSPPPTVNEPEQYQQQQSRYASGYQQQQQQPGYTQDYQQQQQQPAYAQDYQQQQPGYAQNYQQQQQPSYAQTPSYPPTGSYGSYAPPQQVEPYPAAPPEGAFMPDEGGVESSQGYFPETQKEEQQQQPQQTYQAQQPPRPVPQPSTWRPLGQQ